MAPSLVKQIEMALLPLFDERPAGMKHDLPADQRGRWIWSYRTLENYLEWGNRWAAWAKKELGMRMLVDGELMGQPYVQGLIDYQGPEPGDFCSPWTIAGTVSALRKLEMGIYRRWGRQVTLIVPDSLVGRKKRRLALRQRRGHYPAEEIRLLRIHIEAEYRSALEACLALGLRRREVVAVQARDVDLAATAFAVKHPDGTWRAEPLPPGYAGVVRVRKGKGGRPREIGVPERYLGALTDLLGAAEHLGTRLWPISAKQFGYAVIRGCRAAGFSSRGVHGLRHSWALREYVHLRHAGYSGGEARQFGSWWLGHNRIQVTVSYIPRKVDVNEYLSLTSV